MKQYLMLLPRREDSSELNDFGKSSIEIHCLGETTTINQVAAKSCVCNLSHNNSDNDIDSNNGAAKATTNATTKATAEANTKATANATTEANAEVTTNATVKATNEANAKATANTTGRATYKGTCKDPSEAVAQQPCQAATRTGSSFWFCVVGQNHEGPGCSQNAAMLQRVPLHQFLARLCDARKTINTKQGSAKVGITGLSTDRIASPPMTHDVNGQR